MKNPLENCFTHLGFTFLLPIHGLLLIYPLNMKVRIRRITRMSNFTEMQLNFSDLAAYIR